MPTINVSGLTIVRARADSIDCRSGREAGQRLGVIPGHPLRRFAGEPIEVPKQRGQIVEGIHLRELTRVDQTHIQIADASTALGFVEETISAAMETFP